MRRSVPPSTIRKFVSSIDDCLPFYADFSKRAKSTDTLLRIRSEGFHCTELPISVQNDHALQILQNSHPCVFKCSLICLKFHNLPAKKIRLCNSQLTFGHLELGPCPNSICCQLQTFGSSVRCFAGLPVDDSDARCSLCSEIHLACNPGGKAL